MTPIDFEKKNKVYTAPASMPDCLPLPVYQGDGQIMSFWEMDETEKLALIVSSKVWIGIHAERQPPVWLSTIPPFQSEIKGTDIEVAVQKNKEFIEEKIKAFVEAKQLPAITQDLQDMFGEFLLFCLNLEVPEEKV